MFVNEKRIVVLQAARLLVEDRILSACVILLPTPALSATAYIQCFPLYKSESRQRGTTLLYHRTLVCNPVQKALIDGFLRQSIFLVLIDATTVGTTTLPFCATSSPLVSTDILL